MIKLFLNDGFIDAQDYDDNYITIVGSDDAVIKFVCDLLKIINSTTAPLRPHDLQSVEVILDKPSRMLTGNCDFLW